MQGMNSPRGSAESHAAHAANANPAGGGAIVATAPNAYREFANPAEAERDFSALAALAGCGAAAPLAVDVRAGTRPGVVQIRIYGTARPLALQRLVAVLDRFGLCLDDYHSFEFAARNGHLNLQACDATLADAQPGAEAPAAGLARLAPALAAAWRGESEADAFSRLVLVAGLDDRQVAVLRAYAAYLRQVGCAIGQEYIPAALARHPQATRALLELFAARFTPVEGDLGNGTASAADAAATADAADAAGPAGIAATAGAAGAAGAADAAATAAVAEPTAADAASAAFEAALAAIRSNEDLRVLRLYAGLVAATLRTNFYQADADGAAKPYLAFKLDSRAVEGSPAPHPLYEIFVASPSMEGIHLRGAKVARGGIRWSDRRHDYRTEVHGLFKAQMVKNVVIVPEGAKGGFVLKQPPQTAAARPAAIAAYRTLINGLLDLTDNIVDGRIVPPPALRRHDGDDPYLVVAADKGTASFSDIANAIAVERGFWLGDAFASGGSAGYDHKALAITARGAWEAVKRHFRELGIDAQSQPISVAGVGDMSGDVFGNGLLLAPQMRLVAAFDHRHIFVDPRADLVNGNAERQRLFAMPASSWADYSPAAFGPGGAVYARDAAEIVLSPEAQQLFALPETTTPTALLRAILTAPVDLLWLGGIGTYVRASDETDAAVGDRANDALRVCGKALRCKVVGEGANLGLTQRGRIEFARRGGRVDTDAIDNAGGVSCSDHEVNIKILLAGLEREGRLDRPARDALLREMSDDVCSLVLDDIVLQTQALSVAETTAAHDLDRHERLLRFFEKNGQLDRELAGLPDPAAVAERRLGGAGLCRPELAVLLAHTKIALVAEVIASDLPDDPLLREDLFAYFPPVLRERHAEAIEAHPLRREIVTTAAVNSMVNRVGSGFVNDIQERTGATDADIARAYLVARRLWAMEDVWRAIEALDDAASSAAHVRLLVAARQIVETTTLWLLRRLPTPLDISATVARFAPGLAALHAALAGRPEAAAPDAYEDELRAAGAPPELAGRLAQLRHSSRQLDALLVAEAGGRPIDAVVALVGALADTLGLPELIAAVASTPCRSPAESSAMGELAEAMAAVPAGLAERCLRRGSGTTDGMLRALFAPCRGKLARYKVRRDDVVRQGQRVDLAAAVLACEALRALSEGVDELIPAC